MSLIRPFRALRSQPEHVAKVASVPYDVVNQTEAASLAQGNPFSFLHVSRPEIDLPAGTDPYAKEVYEKARENFRKLTQELPLVRETEPSLYIYRLKMGDREQTGIAAAYSIDEYDHGTIKKHEKTRQDKEDDRTRHVLTLGAQTGPVFLTHKGLSDLNAQVARETEATPLFHFTAPDGIVHKLWKVQNPALLVELFHKVPMLYIADGHHRAASASRARAELKKENPKHTGQEDYNFFLAVAFPAEQLRILPYYRVIKDLNGHSHESILSTLEKSFTIAKGAASEPKRGQFSMYMGGHWYGLAPKNKPGMDTSPAARLDVSVLQNQVLDPLFGIKDPRTDKRIDFVGGIRGTRELVELVDSGRAQAAFSLHPTTVDDLMEISDAGEIMPPKSTWFEPKLRDGLLSHIICES
ncbi:MAG: DUF1015 domain-containing protein [Bdellovibrionia bacterium]